MMSFDDYQTDIKWPVPAQPPGDWKTLEQEEAGAILADTLKDGAVSVLCARALPLGFYPEHLAVEVLLDTKNDAGAGVLTLVVGKQATVLRGMSWVIHEFNENIPVSLPDLETAKSYLQFFCFYVHGEQGSFRVIETVDDIPWNSEPGVAKLKRKLKKIIKPVQIKQTSSPSEGFLCDALICYDKALFYSQFHIQKTGMIEMLDDEFLDLEYDQETLPIAPDLCVEAIRYAGQ
ncbi:hypothetical protein MNBD_ALPHA06-773 [hydrothermal vent metagenome]|uniref:Uncharacterized protein n=1 Tax=hydrothermal vent metagenome TaxID=652676 RepID=A0A3B0S9P5_9ZZZZ